MDGLIFSKFSIQNISPEEAKRRSEQNRVSAYNAVHGEDDGTGIHCELCKDKGLIAFIDSDSGNLTTRDCKCHGTRLTVNRLKKCGIWERARHCKLESFHVNTPVQKSMMEAATGFLAHPEGHWLMMCGQSGSGKTHLCTAAFIQMVYRSGMDGQYFLWNADGRKLKSFSMEDNTGLWDKYKTASILYIDDLFKGRQDQGPTDADIRLAFELLDYRYNNRLITILSSEMHFGKLLTIDQAIAGRVKEMCGPYLVSIEADTTKNYRMSP